MTGERTVLVTGGAGFIGSRFVAHHLRACPRDRVVVLDALTYAGSLENLAGVIEGSERVQFVHGSVRSPQIVESVLAGCDAVVHFAAETHVPRSISDSAVFFETDVLGTQTLAALAVARGARLERFVHVSSSEVYGTAVRDPMDEEHPLQPYTPYAAAKCAADRLIYAFVQTYALPAVTVRPFNTYGPGQHLEKLVPRFITSALRGDPLTVHGDGRAARDWVFVDDTCAAIERVLTAPLAAVRGEVFNVGTGVATDVLTLAHEVLRLTGASPRLIEHAPDRPGQVQMHRADPTRIRERLGFVPAVSLAEGLAATVEWYREHRSWWERQLWMRSVPVVGPDGAIRYW
ncbi:MAG TPA: GDP-mannose 4,6-dehydratase [Candidatus Limnocylindria bacterium]|nr:GDP-mannose 4,6-dehydratase [Candidatus Limnocylindria bacterium]